MFWVVKKLTLRMNLNTNHDETRRWQNHGVGRFSSSVAGNLVTSHQHTDGVKSSRSLQFFNIVPLYNRYRFNSVYKEKDKSNPIIKTDSVIQ